MEYNGDLFRDYVRNDGHEIGTKFDDSGATFDDFGLK